MTSIWHYSRKWRSVVSRGRYLQYYFPKQVVVILQGIPGIGKNAIADNLVENFGKRVYVLDQDRYAHLGRKPASKKCREVFNDMLYSDEYDIIILARNNATSFQYTSYLDMAQDALWKTVVSAQGGRFDPMEELVAVCSESVLMRENHPTVNGTPNERLKIVALFAGSSSLKPQGYHPRFILWRP